MFTRSVSGWMRGEGQDMREHGNCGSGEVHAMRWWPVRRWRCWSGRDTDVASRQFWCHTHGTSHPRMLWTLQRHGQSRDMWTLQRHGQSRDMWTLQEKMRPIPNTRACTQSLRATSYRRVSVCKVWAYRDHGIYNNRDYNRRHPGLELTILRWKDKNYLISAECIQKGFGILTKIKHEHIPSPC